MLALLKLTRLKVINREKWTKKDKTALITVVFTNKNHNSISNNSITTVLPTHLKNKNTVKD